MNIQYELEQPFRYSWTLVYLILAWIGILIVGYLLIKFSPFFSKYFKKFFRKTTVPSLKTIYLRKLERLKNSVNNNRIDNRNAYLELSTIARGFIKKATGINTLSISKKEAKELHLDGLTFLMEDYYPAEFSKDKKGDIINSINKTMEVIKRWN